MSDNKTIKEINILLLGETGVGKSTFINAFFNYVNFEKLEEALNNETICLIPTQFVVTDENFKSHSVKFGKSDNERFEETGHSSTKSCRTYIFQYGNGLIRLIDTPGIGDTRGVEEDKKNIKDIFSFISDYKELHLICILLKPDMPRLTTTFVYCLKQLLCHLQKDASKNIVFLFTTTRQTHFKPKNTLVPLNEVFNEIKTKPPFVEISFDKKTMYCLDNDSIQFLIAVRNGIKFGDDERNAYIDNWNKSVNECKRLINYIFTGCDGLPLKPHPIQNTLSIDETRHLIVTLTQPIAFITNKLSSEILPNINKIIKEIEMCKANSKQLLDLIESNRYEYSSDCYDYIPIVGNITSAVKSSRLAEAETKIAELKRKLSNERNCIEVKNQMLKNMNDMKERYLKEKETIVKSSAKFAVFLKNNSIVNYNKSYKDYIQAQIENLKTITPHNYAHKEKINDSIKRLENTIEEYEREMEIVEKAIESANEDTSQISLENINKLVQKLYALEITGEQIRRRHQQSKCFGNVQGKKEEKKFVLNERASWFFNGIKTFFNYKFF